MIDSIEAGAALNDLNVPLFAVAVSAAKNIHGWWKGSRSLSDIPFEIAVDSTIKAGLTISGGFVGGTLGLLLLGPAGAVIAPMVTAPGALLASGVVRHRIESRLHPEWIDTVAVAVDKFRTALRQACEEKLHIIRHKIKVLNGLQGEEISWLVLRFKDDALAIAEAIHNVNQDDVETDPTNSARRLLAFMHDSGVHPWAVRNALDELLATLNNKPTARKSLESIPGRFAKWRSSR